MWTIKSLFRDQLAKIREPWDYLIILDACRYDIFVDHWSGEKPVKLYSPASTTLEWFEKVFPDQYPITIYSSNPYISTVDLPTWKYYPGNHFHRIIDLWKFGWNKKDGTVLPRTVYRYAKNAEPKSIIWFLQPHFPYLTLPLHTETPIEMTYNPAGKTPILKQLTNKYSFEEIKVAYRINLVLALKYVYRLIDRLKGRIVVSSDHGELLGEHGLYSHPPKTIRELREVPWVEINR